MWSGVDVNTTTQHLDSLFLWYNMATCLYLPLDIFKGPGRVFVQAYIECFHLQGSDADVGRPKGRLWKNLLLVMLYYKWDFIKQDKFLDQHLP